MHFTFDTVEKLDLSTKEKLCTSLLIRKDFTFDTLIKINLFIYNGMRYG